MSNPVLRNSILGKIGYLIYDVSLIHLSLMDFAKTDPRLKYAMLSYVAINDVLVPAVKYLYNRRSRRRNNRFKNARQVKCTEESKQIKKIIEIEKKMKQMLDENKQMKKIINENKQMKSLIQELKQANQELKENMKKKAIENNNKKLNPINSIINKEDSLINDNINILKNKTKESFDSFKKVEHDIKIENKPIIDCSNVKNVDMNKSENKKSDISLPSYSISTTTLPSITSPKKLTEIESTTTKLTSTSTTSTPIKLTSIESTTSTPIKLTSIESTTLTPIKSTSVKSTTSTSTNSLFSTIPLTSPSSSVLPSLTSPSTLKATSQSVTSPSISASKFESKFTSSSPRRKTLSSIPILNSTPKKQSLSSTQSNVTSVVTSTGKNEYEGKLKNSLKRRYSEKIKLNSEKNCSKDIDGVLHQIKSPKITKTNIKRTPGSSIIKKKKQNTPKSDDVLSQNTPKRFVDFMDHNCRKEYEDRFQRMSSDSWLSSSPLGQKKRN